jgi:hypothetical protein
MRPAEFSTKGGISMNVRNGLALRAVLIFVVLAGLGIDAYVHFHLASAYSGVKTSTLSQGDLFRVEGALAALAGLLLLIRPHRYTAAFAFLVTAGGTAAVVVYRYVNVGKFGPIPNMYEPIWYGEKTLSLWGEAIAAVVALALVVVLDRRARQSVNLTAARGTAQV